MDEKYSVDQDKNKNGIIDDDELTSEQVCYKVNFKSNNCDVIHLFIFIYSFTALFLLVKFFAWMFFGVIIDISSDKLALTLNVFIVIVGSAEGIRSFNKSIVSDVGESVPVPKYKLRYLFNYLLSFSFMTILAVVLEFLAKSLAAEGQEIPTFSADKFLNGVVGNVVAYLIARYGNKVVENIDLSEFKIFKNKE